MAISEVKSSSASVVLVHGLWHGAWAWEKVQRDLDARGISNMAVSLPAPGRGAGDPTFDGHVTHLRDELARMTRPIVVVSHSYGGAVVTEAADPAAVDALVFVSAFNLNPDESIADIADGGSAASVSAEDIDIEEGLLVVDRDTALSGFYQDCEPAEAEAAFARLVSEHPSTRTSRVTRASWQEIPSTFVLCTEDQALSHDVQRQLASRITNVVELHSGHSPMLSRPKELGDVIESVVQSVG